MDILQSSNTSDEIICTFQLVDLLKSHPVTKKEIHGIKVTTKVLDELTPQEVRDLRIVFDIFDTNSDG